MWFQGAGCQATGLSHALSPLVFMGKITPSGKAGSLTQFTVVLKLTHDDAAVKNRVLASSRHGFEPRVCRALMRPWIGYLASLCLRSFVFARVAVHSSPGLGRVTGDSAHEAIDAGLVPKEMPLKCHLLF